MLNRLTVALVLAGASGGRIEDAGIVEDFKPMLYGWKKEDESCVVCFGRETR
jgi:hypothetical protein